MCNKEKFWPLLCDLVGKPEWSKNEQYATFKSRLKHRKEITDMLDQTLSMRTTAEWLKIFSGKIPSAPILNIKEALENPFVVNNGKIQYLLNQNEQPFQLLASPVKFTDEDMPASPAPELGEHTTQILSSIGIKPEDITRLRLEGVV